MDGVVEDRRSDKVTSIVLMFGEQIVKVICAYGPHSERTMAEKQEFYELAYERNLRSNAEIVLGLGGFNGHVEKRIDGLKNIHGGNGFGEKYVEGERLLEF